MKGRSRQPELQPPGTSLIAAAAQLRRGEEVTVRVHGQWTVTFQPARGSDILAGDSVLARVPGARRRGIGRGAVARAEPVGQRIVLDLATAVRACESQVRLDGVGWISFENIFGRVVSGGR